MSSASAVSKSWSPPLDGSSLVHGGRGSPLEVDKHLLDQSFGVKEPDFEMGNARL